MLQRNASVKKEWFPPTQFNKFAAVKQADLLGFEPGQNICIDVLYRAVVLNNFLKQYRKWWIIHLTKNREDKNRYHVTLSLAILHMCKRFRMSSSRMFEWEQKKKWQGRGRGEKEMLAHKPLDFEKLRSPINAASDWCGAGSVD